MPPSVPSFLSHSLALSLSPPIPHALIASLAPNSLDPLSDLLAHAQVDDHDPPSLVPPTNPTGYPRPDVLPEPFANGWDGSATPAWANAAAEPDRTGQRQAVADRAQASNRDADLSTFHSSSPKGPERAPFAFNPAATTFTPTSSSSSSPHPIAMPLRTSVSPAARNRSSSGASTLNTASSATPRGVPSPFAHIESPEPIVKTAASSPTSPPAGPPRPVQPSRSPSTVSSSRGYDPAVLRNLIAAACANGDLERLQSLMTPRIAVEGEPEPPSPFTLANQTSSQTGLAPLHYAAQRGHTEVVKWLIEEAGAMPELEDGEGETPLHKAAHRGHLDVCRFLISRDVDVDAADSDGWTALHNAASRGWLDVARLLLDAGSAVDKASKHRYTALMNAASKGQLPLVNFLLKKQADPLCRNAFGETAYDLAAAVFEVQICTVLAAAEASAQPGNGEPAAYNPLALHSTVPVVLYENQRLALPSLKKLSSLGSGPRWTPKALSRNDDRAAYSMPPLAGCEGAELACFRSEVRLPVIGDEVRLGLPAPREVRSGGRVKVAAPDGPSAVPRPVGPRPQARRASSSAESSLTAVLAASSSPTPEPPPAQAPSARGEPAWIWLSDWVVDVTSPSSSAQDGWSYAPSFSAPADEWSPSPPADVLRALDGGAAGLAALAGSAGRKYVRRRRWVRLMRRRLDLADWGYADTGAGARAGERDPWAGTEGMDYLARARFFAGVAHAHAGADDAASIRAGAGRGKAPDLVGAVEAGDRVELRKAAARLERATDELRRGMGGDADEGRRREAQDVLEGFLHQLGELRAQLGANGDVEEADSDDEFVYSGKDADADDDARSIWTTRPPSVASGPSSSDYLAQPGPSSPATSVRPVLTPQIAPEFRVPTHEQAPASRVQTGAALQPRPIRARWEPDEATNTCRRCEKRFSLFNRKHHCRRCGLVICAACSPHSDALDPYTIALEPGDFVELEQLLTSTQARYRTCSDCHAALSLPQGLGGPTSLLSPQAFFPALPSPGSVTPSETAASDVSELAECPVCGTQLGGLGDKAEQEEHIRQCLETGGGSVSSGRYLVFKLPLGPLVGQECAVCFDDFEVGDKMARLVCLCTFHEHCIASWLSRGHSCPVHPNHRDT
ncbi:hypothetical protein JCM3770_007386 [Rhodotorula araucariae]